ncbi:MAG: fructosamine kinase family protein [Oligoflexales bacterium]|nr:fructosamine kinase family protein [Oligoflexales bacterium]
MSLQKKIETVTGRKVRSLSSVGGGCIAASYRVVQEGGGSLFCKTEGGKSGMFQAEADGLSELGKAGAIRVPKVIYYDAEILLIEHIEVSAGRSGRFFEEFGRSFARLHKFTSEWFGFHSDNFIGRTLQKNRPQVRFDPGKPSGGWASFYLGNRLGYQYELLSRSGHAGSELERLFHNAEKRLPDLLNTSPEPASLLHGDLWGGNYLIDSEGRACLIDPAVYYGHREADLAMTSLFGGFERSFYSAYNEEYPLEHGYAEREPLYHLYHLMNHLNMFGSSYLGQVMGIMRRYFSVGQQFPESGTDSSQAP